MINELIDELANKELNLDKIFKLSESEQKIIFGLFDELMNCFYGERGINLPSGFKIDCIKSSVLYKTLSNNEFLITQREKNLNSILEK